ncbi:hypothetical protein ACFXPS_25665 [Nocardia sp. NPDC059091]|uniref:hypothetical protein n=1 Tax=unclassified Nocardia TaxID=2637762 RepID=UPI00368240CA
MPLTTKPARADRSKTLFWATRPATEDELSNDADDDPPVDGEDGLLSGNGLASYWWW